MSADPNSSADAGADGQMKLDLNTPPPASNTTTASGSTNTQGTGALPPLVSKSVVIYKNGDSFYPGKRFVINRRQMRTWRAFLENVGTSLQMTNGARRLRTPRNGTVVKNFDQLQHNGTYVVGGAEHFKSLEYLDIKEPMRFVPTAKTNQIFGSSDNVAELAANQEIKTPKANNQVNSRYATFTSYGKTINVYPNGDEFARPTIVVLRPHESDKMRNVVKAVAERLVLPNGFAIRRIYDMNGELVKHAVDLQNAGYYVAAGYEKFLQVNYGSIPPPLVVSPRRKQPPLKYLSDLPTPEKSELEREREDQPWLKSSSYPTLADSPSPQQQQAPPQTRKNKLPPIKEGAAKPPKNDVFHAQESQQNGYAPTVTESGTTRLAFAPDADQGPAEEVYEQPNARSAPLPPIQSNRTEEERQSGGAFFTTQQEHENAAPNMSPRSADEGGYDPEHGVQVSSRMGAPDEEPEARPMEEGYGGGNPTPLQVQNVEDTPPEGHNEEEDLHIPPDTEPENEAHEEAPPLATSPYGETQRDAPPEELDSDPYNGPEAAEQPEEPLEETALPPEDQPDHVPPAAGSEEEAAPQDSTSVVDQPPQANGGEAEAEPGEEQHQADGGGIGGAYWPALDLPTGSNAAGEEESKSAKP